MRNSMRRSCGHARVAFEHAVLHLDGAAHRVDHTAELDERAVAGALDHASMMHDDGRVDEVAAQCPQPRERAFLVRAGEPAVADHVGGEDGGEFSGLGYGTPRVIHTSGTSLMRQMHLSSGNPRIRAPSASLSAICRVRPI